VRFEVFAVVTIQVKVFWVVTPYSMKMEAEWSSKMLCPVTTLYGVTSQKTMTWICNLLLYVLKLITWMHTGLLITTAYLNWPHSELHWIIWADLRFLGPHTCTIRSTNGSLFSVFTLTAAMSSMKTNMSLIIQDTNTALGTVSARTVSDCKYL